MAGMINQLLELLNEQATRYEELLGLSREKRDIIIANDVDGLQKITHLEHLVVSQNQKLEKKRIAIIKDIAVVLNKKENELTIQALAELLQGQAEQQALIEVGGRIRKTMEELSGLNAHNASLIQNALDYIEYSLNVIRSTVSRDQGVYPTGGKAESPALFDARH